MTLQRCFLFDIDGTLVNLRSIWEQTYTTLYEQTCGFTLTAQELQSLFGPPELEGHCAILQGAGLRAYFSVMGCSDEKTTRRAEIVQGAVNEFGTQGFSFDAQQIYVIGDTPKDVEGAKECGYISVAVATGHYSLEELRETRSNFLLHDLSRFVYWQERVRVG